MRKLPRDIQIPDNIRPGYKKTRFYTDNEVIDIYGKIIGPYGLALYSALARGAHSKDQCTFLTIETLMEMSGIGNRNTVLKHLNILLKLKLIRIFKEYKKVNIYCLLRVLHPSEYGADISSIKIEHPKYQFKLPASIETDTVNQSIKSEKEINTSYSLKARKELQDEMERIRLGWSIKPEKTLPKAYNLTPSSENTVEQLEPNIAINEGLNADTPPLI